MSKTQHVMHSGNIHRPAPPDEARTDTNTNATDDGALNARIGQDNNGGINDSRRGGKRKASSNPRPRQFQKQVDRRIAAHMKRIPSTTTQTAMTQRKILREIHITSNHRDNPSTSTMTKTATAKGMDGASIAGHTMAELEDEIAMRTATSQHSAQGIDALKKGLSEASMPMQISSLKIDLSSAVSEKDVLENQVKSITSDLASVREESERQTINIAEHQSTIDALSRSANHEVRKVLSWLISEREMFASSLHRTKEDASRFERERNEAIAQLHGSQDSVAELKGEVDRLVAEVDSSKTENGVLLSQVEAVTTKYDAVASELKRCLCKLERVTAEKNALATELANVEADSKDKKELLMSKLMRAKKQVCSAIKERDDMVSQLNSLQGSVAELTSETDRLRAELNASNNEKDALLSQLETMTFQGDPTYDGIHRDNPTTTKKNIAIGFDNDVVSVVALKDSTNDEVDKENVPPTVNNPPSAKPFSLKGVLRDAKTANKCMVGAADDKSEVSNCDDAVDVGIRRDNNKGISGSGMGTPYNDGNDKDQLPNNGNIGDGVELMTNTDTTNDIVDKEEEVRDTTPTNDFDRDHSTEAPSKCRDTVGAVGESNPELESILLPATDVTIDLPESATASNVTSNRSSIHWPDTLNQLEQVCLYYPSQMPWMVNQKDIPISSCSHHLFKYITSKKLVHVNSETMSRRYTKYLQRTLRLSHKVCQEAWRVQGFIECANGNQWKTRLDMNSEEEIMNNVPNFCKDESVNGLPMRTIFTIGPSYDVIYEFVISIKKSNCCTDAGNGAFLTFKGAKLLCHQSNWKQAAYKEQAAETRETLEAYRSDSRCTVTLVGRDIHDDNRVDFVAADFIDADNITFSSKHIECGLVELESRYGPLLPTDRKTDLIFTVKDFLFSHEPSSWRFDVKETLNTEKLEPDASRTHYNSICRSSRTQPTVIDFTDDATGAPHEVAQSHVSMYVNEVGHDASLVENIHAMSSRNGSVIYYINIDKPLSKGDTVELLTNYTDTYEPMRVRRGYGKDGVKGDDNDIARVQRNVQERFEIEKTIKTYVLCDLVEVVHFLYDRVWSSLKSLTSKFDEGCSQTDLKNLTRQCIARRRIDWIMRLLSNHLTSLLGNWTAVKYRKGDLIFVHKWPQNGARPPYIGLAVIDSIAKDEHNRETFDVTIPDNKRIWSVPEGVVTFPTEDEMKTASNRERKQWKQWQAEQAIPQILDYIETFKWDASFVRSMKASLPTSQGESTILHSLRWDVVEEILFVLVKNNRVLPQFVATDLCPMSASFVLECLLLIADFLLVDNADLGELFQSLMELGRVATNKVKATCEQIRMPPDQDTLSLVSKLCFETGLSEDQRRLVVEPNNEVSLCHFLNNPMRLDYDWYAIHQIALPLHQIASVLDWGNLYSVENLCNELSLELSSNERSKFKDWKPLL